MTEKEWNATTSIKKMTTYLWEVRVGEYRTGREEVSPPFSRKLRLFAVACLRHCYPQLQPDLRRDLLTLEAIAEGKITGADVWKAGPQTTVEDVLTYTKQFCHLSGNAACQLFREIMGNPFAFTTVEHRNKTWNEQQTVRMMLQLPFNLTQSMMTPDVRRLAEEAYSLILIPCPERYGKGWHKAPEGYGSNWACETCGGSEIITGQNLDHTCLSALADALEEAGLYCDPCRRCKGSKAIVPYHDGYYLVEPDPIPCPICNATGRAGPSSILSHLRSSQPHYRGCWALDCVREAL